MKNAPPLPPDLIEEILVRLPVKPLVRFRSVSKQCLSLTMDPQFTKSNFHLRGAAPINGLLYLMHSYSKEARWVDVDKSIHRYHVARLPVPYHSEPAMIDSCRGFVLLDNNVMHGWSFILWNPLTGVHKTLPGRSKYHPGYEFWHHGSDFSWCGFGYDESSDDYLIVIGWQDRDGSRTWWEFFSVRANSWKKIATSNNNFPRVMSVHSVYGVFLNGAIHWLAIDYVPSNSNIRVLSGVIIAFDLTDKSISEIRLPNLGEDGFGGCYSHLKVLGGCLGLSCLKDRETRIIWVMKEYKVHSTWTKYYSVCHNGAIIPMCFTEGGDLVATEDFRRLVKFSEGILVERQVDDHFRRDNHVTFTPTLLSLPGDIEE